MPVVSDTNHNDAKMHHCTSSCKLDFDTFDRGSVHYSQAALGCGILENALKMITGSKLIITII